MALVYHWCQIQLVVSDGLQYGDDGDHIYAHEHAFLLHVDEKDFLHCAIIHALHRVKHSPLWTIHK